MSLVTRFAPSPTGPLHLGHAFSAVTAFRLAEAAGGAFLLRIEDIDQSRARPEWEAAILADLAWLGVTWPDPAMRQSDRLPAYRAALDRLAARRLIYPCSCRRRDILEAARAPQDGAPPTGPDGVVYPGTCRGRDRAPPFPPGASLRLDLARALESAGEIAFTEAGTGPRGETGRIAAAPEAMIAGIGDPVLARRDLGTSYHLAVVVDDAAQGVTDVVRGEDLFDATPIHVLLQRLLGLPTPVYRHHRLIRDAAGRRLAKRDDARAIATYRAEGSSPAEVLALVDLPPAATASLRPPAP